MRCLYIHCALLHSRILSKIYFMSECLSTYSKPSWSNDYYCGESPRAKTNWHARDRKSMGWPVFLKRFLQYSESCGATLCLCMWLQPYCTHLGSLSPQRGHGNTVLRSGLILSHVLYLYQSFMAEMPLLICDQSDVLFCYQTPVFSFPVTETAGHGAQECNSG